jgi:MurNAc alpha-1-phosphate uridylyltransferase
MTSPPPKKAMILAAGLGTRMRPIINKKPKALIRIGDRSLIDRVLDRLVDEGVETVVVNVHHLGDMIERELGDRADGPTILFSPEETLLETGGGVAKALSHFADEPFFVANADIMWLNGPQSALARLAQAWDDDTMDALLMLHSTVDAYGYQGRGDFCANPDGRLTRRPEMEVTPFLFTGVQILHPRLFVDAPEGPFSLNRLYDQAIDTDRLYGMVSDGEWFDVGTPDGLDEAERYLVVRYAETKHR